MVNSPCTVDTKRDKTWTYDEHYIGDTDEEKRKSGEGCHHWLGAKSIECYCGKLLRDTMHGAGEYRCRQRGDGSRFTFEGHFYCNKMHGYGTMSYPDGRVFTGLFHSDVRWGPGVESQVCLREDVGLWRGRRLIRLAWRPSTPAVAPDLYSTLAGKACVDPHRVMLVESCRKIGETNGALDLLKQFGADPRVATDKWVKLYPKNCTDLNSPLCHIDGFDYTYYNGKINFLHEISYLPDRKEDISQDSIASHHNLTTYYAWNNNKLLIHMMKHTYMHDAQRNPIDINVSNILSGPRKLFKPAGRHELDCRTLLMACYLGLTKNVVELVNNCNIDPDITDNLGNSAITYAACGDNYDIIHFLVEAGANVDSFNDSCCTPLAVLLMRFMCAQKDITSNGMLQALLPTSASPALQSVEQKIFEWNFSRDHAVTMVASGINRSPSKTSKIMPGVKKIKSSKSLKDISNIRKRTDVTSSPKPPGLLKNFSEESFVEDKMIYNRVNSEFETKINELFLRSSGISPIPYLFEVQNMLNEMDAPEEEPKKGQEKPKKVLSKVLKDTMKPSKEMMWQSTDKEEYSSIDSIERQKGEMLARMMLTILQLLSDGANPNLVKCPRPALYMAIVSGCPDLVKHLVSNGADINEIYNEDLRYTPLDLAMSRPFTYENVVLIRAILECGAITSHRLRLVETASVDNVMPEDRGPTLLHAVLARKTDSDSEDQIKHKIVEILLEYNCDPLLKFKGRSALDIAMTKSMSIFDIFIRSPTTNLNAPINDMNQTVLVKMFCLPFFKTLVAQERLQTLTNLLLFGADPLIECCNGDEKYPNIFIFAASTLNELEAAQHKSNPVSSPNKSDSKKGAASKKEMLTTKSTGKIGVDDIGEYKQSIDLVTECARMLHVRWLQAKLFKELVEIIERYKHRHWNMIIKEHKHRKRTGLWLTAQRCLEIWDIMKMTKKKVYNDNRVLKHLLNIVQYYSKLRKIVPSAKPTAVEKSSIESDVSYLLREHAANVKLASDLGSWKKPYVKPELTSRLAEKKFNICFECSLPFKEEKIKCVSCKLISFCSFGCMKLNIDRANCHPCSNYLKMKYFPSPPESETNDIFPSL